MIFKIGDVDYSAYLISPYNINQRKEYDAFIDGGGNKHKIPTRQYIDGTAKIKLSEELYIKFLADVQSVKNDELYQLTLTVNNINSTVTSYFYMEFFPELIKDTIKGKKYAIIDLEVEQF